MITYLWKDITESRDAIASKKLHIKKVTLFILCLRFQIEKMQSDQRIKVALDQKTGLNRLTKLTTSFYVILEMLCNYRISPCLAM